MNKEEFLNKLLKTLEEKYSTEELMLANVLSDIALTISRKRISMGMTQSEFAETIGVDTPMVSRWESGRSRFTLSTLATIAAKLNMDLVNPLRERIEEDK